MSTDQKEALPENVYFGIDESSGPDLTVYSLREEHLDPDKSTTYFMVDRKDFDAVVKDRDYWKQSSFAEYDKRKALEAEIAKMREALTKAKWLHDHIMSEKKRVDWGKTFDIDWGKVNDTLIAVDKALAQGGGK